MTSYVWSVSAGGSITSGGTATSNFVTVTWTSAGAKSVSVSYTNSSGCSAPAPPYGVTVYPVPVPTLSGPTPVCVNSPGKVYTTEASMTNYVWTIPSGATKTAGGGSTNNTVTLTWTATGAKVISVNYTNAGGCTATAPKQLNVIVNPIPVPPISGPTSTCAGVNTVYMTAAGQTNYIWTISSPDGQIISGQGTRMVTVKWTNPLLSHWIGLNFTNSGGCSAPSPTIMSVNVTSCKSDPIITDTTNTNNGNNTISLGKEYVDFNVYPNPNDGTFTMRITASESGIYNLQAFSSLGVLVYEIKYLEIKNDAYIRKIDLSYVADGVYNFILKSSKSTIQKRVVIRK